jgi:hypothetical protein
VFHAIHAALLAAVMTLLFSATASADVKAGRKVDR